MKKITWKKVLIAICSLLAIISLLGFFLFNRPVEGKDKFPAVAPERVFPIETKIIPEITITPEQNQKIGTFVFPKEGIEVPLIYGYNAEYMEQYFDEVGLEAWGNFPGQDKKLYINGHRHLAFQSLKNIVVGDTIELKMDYGTFTYEVVKEPIVVKATDKEAIDYYYNDHDTTFSPQILRLQTCYPFEAGSTLDHRYLVDLVLVDSQYN